MGNKIATLDWMSETREAAEIAARIAHFVDRRYPGRGGRARAARDLGVSPANLSKQLSGKAVPDVDTIRRFAAHFEVTVADLLGEGGTLADRLSFSLPDKGWVPAGPLADAVEQNEVVAFHEMFRGDGLFCLHVQGQSMIAAGIMDGDIIIVRPTRTAAVGDIVVAIVGEEKTVKKLARTDGELFLVSCEQDGQSVYARESDAGFSVLGVVIGGAWTEKERSRAPARTRRHKK